MIVETESAIYALDVVTMKLKRFPRDTPIAVENPRNGLPAVVASLRMDEEAIPYTPAGTAGDRQPGAVPAAE